MKNSLLILLLALFLGSCEDEQGIKDSDDPAIDRIEFPNFSLDSMKLGENKLNIHCTDLDKNYDAITSEQRTGYALYKSGHFSVPYVDTVELIFQMPNRERGVMIAQVDLQYLKQMTSIYSIQGMPEIAEFVMVESFKDTVLGGRYFNTHLNVAAARAKYGSFEEAAKHTFFGINAMKVYALYLQECRNVFENKSADFEEAQRIIDALNADLESDSSNSNIRGDKRVMEMIKRACDNSKNER